MENALSADDDDDEIENDAMLEQNINNDNDTDEDLIVTTNEEDNVMDNSHFYVEFQNELVSGNTFILIPTPTL